MNTQQIRGFKIFMDADKGNCMACHAPPNFTDNGFHNIGLAQFAGDSPDMGRFAHIPVRVLKGAFKTPSLRNVTLTAPYFHDGSAKTLEDVVAHYVRGGDVKTNLSPTMKPLSLTPAEQQDLVAFLRALTSPPSSFMLPVLPPEPMISVRSSPGVESVTETPKSP
ncbi:MAG: c-type cytochrome [Pseudomonadota bacterium]